MAGARTCLHSPLATLQDLRHCDHGGYGCTAGNNWLLSRDRWLQHEACLA